MSVRRGIFLEISDFLGGTEPSGKSYVFNKKIEGHGNKKHCSIEKQTWIPGKWHVFDEQKALCPGKNSMCSKSKMKPPKKSVFVPQTNNTAYPGEKNLFVELNDSQERILKVALGKKEDLIIERIVSVTVSVLNLRRPNFKKKKSVSRT